jgi:hypothetical protein
MDKTYDVEYEEDRITAVEGNRRKGWGITRENGWCFYVPAHSLIEPKVGMMARFYGRGIGYTVRGLDLDGIQVFYRTPEQQREKDQADLLESERKQKAEFERARESMDRRVDTLPRVFRERIEKFRKNNPDFRWKYEGYELFVCEEAIKIAAWCKTTDAIKAFHKLLWEEQKKAGVSDDHSGNTLGMAFRLALWYVTVPENGAKDHGALTPLVGCKDYGCPHDA